MAIRGGCRIQRTSSTRFGPSSRTVNRLSPRGEGDARRTGSFIGDQPDINRKISGPCIGLLRHFDLILSVGNHIPRVCASQMFAARGARRASVDLPDVGWHRWSWRPLLVQFAMPRQGPMQTAKKIRREVRI